MALQYHPDKNKAPGADEVFKRIGKAFSVLSDENLKRQYDLYGEESANRAQQRGGHQHGPFGNNVCCVICLSRSTSNGKVQHRFSVIAAEVWIGIAMQIRNDIAIEGTICSSRTC